MNRKRSTYPSDNRPPTREEEFFAHMAGGIDPITAAAASGYGFEKKPEDEPEVDFAESISGFGIILGVVAIISFVVWCCR